MESGARTGAFVEVANSQTAKLPYLERERVNEVRSKGVTLSGFLRGTLALKMLLLQT